MTFRVGQKVVCVDDADCFDQRWLGLRAAIRNGNVYQIAWTGLGRTGTPCVRLVSVRRDHPDQPDAPFGAFRFRPVVQRDASIEIFRAMLNSSRIGVDA